METTGRGRTGDGLRGLRFSDWEMHQLLELRR
jgi:hypothetical protein